MTYFIYSILKNVTYTIKCNAKYKGAVTLQRMKERMGSVWKFRKKILIRTTFECLNPSYRRRSVIVAFITVCVAYTSV